MNNVHNPQEFGTLYVQLNFFSLLLDTIIETHYLIVIKII